MLLLFFFLLQHARGLQDLGSLSRSEAKALAVGAPNQNHWTNREPQTPGNIHQSEVSQSFSSQHQGPAVPNSLQTPLLEASGQTTSKKGTQSYS